MAGGIGLFLIIMIVDIICGPLLTLVIFNPTKPREELLRDILVVVFLQFIALSYGVYAIAEARPVFLAFEGDRFRVVSKADIDFEGWNQDNATQLTRLSLRGPVLIGTTLLDPSDIEFTASVIRSMNGVHPSHRPDRWVTYESQREAVKVNATPVARLKEVSQAYAETVNTLVTKLSMDEGDLGFYPLVSYSQDDWSVVVKTDSGELVGFLPLDAWITR
tara:strand:- start:668 stop:1324 length:657 start_codon:yes stop_codon:yes gene_type:complete